jgi:hypothetical protein
MSAREEGTRVLVGAGYTVSIFKHFHFQDMKVALLFISVVHVSIDEDIGSRGLDDTYNCDLPADVQRFDRHQTAVKL